MKTIYATYIDHQQEIGYPVDYLKSKNADLLIFDGGMTGIYINKPSDIADAQNICIDLLFYKRADFVVWQQADILITEIGQNIINDFIENGSVYDTLSLRTTCMKLFHHCGYNDFGVTVIGREVWKHEQNKFTGDGAYLGTGGAETNPTVDAAIEIGYMGIDQSRRHVKQHKITWNADDPITELPDDEFVRQFVKRHNVKGLISKDSPYFKIVQEMGLEEDYEKVKNIMS